MEKVIVKNVNRFKFYRILEFLFEIESDLKSMHTEKIKLKKTQKLIDTLEDEIKKSLEGEAPYVDIWIKDIKNNKIFTKELFGNEFYINNVKSIIQFLDDDNLEFYEKMEPKCYEEGE